MKSVSLDKEARNAMIVLLRRHEEESIRFFKPNRGAQAKFFELLSEKREVAYFAGNKSGKTYCGAKFCVQACLGEKAAEYGLEVLYREPVAVWVGSVDYKTQREAAQECITKLMPKKEIKKIYTLQNGIIDKIELYNGSSIGFKTYDQGRKAWQGPVKTIVWFDEEPPQEIIEEGMARLTAKNAKLIFTMTPLLGVTHAYRKFVEQVQDWRGYVFGSTYENAANLTPEYFMTMESLDERTKQQRLFGQFVRLEGLVYSDFDINLHVIPHFEPNKKEYLFFGGMDFGAEHPTAFVIMGVNMHGDVYIFGEYKESDARMEEHAEGWHHISKGYDVKRIFRDPSAAQAGLEFARLRDRELRIQTFKGVNDRPTGISLINGLFRAKRLFISSRCVELIYELGHHKYKNTKNGKDGDVVKVDDDLCDATRYGISSIAKVIKKPVLKREEIFNLPKKVANLGTNW